ncbi:MAG: adenylosuccinate lyase family protein [Silicimonas sp.]|nr:adenylosuccinate lyase family protein [Silicimonas sp.]
MSASPIDSAIYRQLFGDKDVGALFTDSAEVRAMMLVEGALAKVQSDLGVIPKTAGKAIHRASLELQLDPGALASGAGQSAVPVPALVVAFREAMQAPEHANWLHWGATSQDIMDTGLALRLRQALGIIDTRLMETARALGSLAEQHSKTPMVARTYGQAAVVTTFGAQIASWGVPLLRARARLSAVTEDVTKVSLSGAAGTLSAMEKGPQVRAELAKALGLTDPRTSWHSTRDSIAGLAAWATMLCGSLGKMGEDLLLMTQFGIDEVRLAAAGDSSTMPQKNNPVTPSLLVAIARQTVGLNSVIQSALPHRQQRDGAAWMTEWLSLPQIVLLTARALSVAQELACTLTPEREKMELGIAETNGTLFAEALSFALAETMSRTKAQATVKTLISEAVKTRQSLQSLVEATYPKLNAAQLFDPSKHLGTAPDEARAFAVLARDTK